MKKLIGLSLIFSLLTGTVQAEAFKSPDILVDSKLDFDWSGVLVRRARKLLQNYNMYDPFSSKFDEPLTMNDSLLNDYLPAESRELVDQLGHMIGLDILSGKTKITIEGLSYDINGFKTDFKASEQQKDGVVIASDFSASHLNLAAAKISLSLEIPVKGNQKAPVVQIDILNPVVSAKNENLIKFFAKVKIQDKPGVFKLNIQESNFERMADELLKNPSQIDISIGRIVVPSLDLKVGNKVLKISPKQVEDLLIAKQDGLKGLLIAQFASLLKKGVGDTALKLLEKYEFKKEYWLDSSVIQSQILISKFASSLTRNNLEVNLPGDFCTKEKFTALSAECVSHKTTQASKSRIIRGQHNESLDHMKSLIDNGEANLVASISEDYVNKLLVATYDAGLWKQTLDEANVELGPEKVFIRLDEKGASGTLYMDVKYKFSSFQGFVLGRKGIRFPLALKVALRIEKHDNIPVMIIRLNDVDLSDETLMNGRPDLGLPSTIMDLPRLKKKVVKTIRKQLEGMKGKDVIDLRYPELRGLGLETVNFLSDGNGRMNAVMRLEDLTKDLN